jgi:hypothetical protein
LFKNKDVLTEDIYLTVKVIETSDVDLSAQIISTTNSQSQVVKEAFATIKPYHRRLEDFFSAMRNSNYEFYYERRPHQYDHQEIRHSLIVTAPALIKSFVSVVLEQPHKVHYYYGTLLEEYNRDKYSELFSDSDYPGLYFAAHHLASKTKNAIAFKKPSLKDWVFHLSLLVKKQIAPQLTKTSNLNDKGFHSTLHKIDKEFNAAFDEALRIISEMRLPTNENRVPSVTNAILMKLNKVELKKQPAFSSNLENVAALKLSNGTYSGIVIENNVDEQIVRLRYGPYLVDVQKSPAGSSYPIVGSRVQFDVKAGKYRQVTNTDERQLS